MFGVYSHSPVFQKCRATEGKTNPQASRIGREKLVDNPRRQTIISRQLNVFEANAVKSKEAPVVALDPEVSIGSLSKRRDTGRSFFRAPGRMPQVDELLIGTECQGPRTPKEQDEDTPEGR